MRRIVTLRQRETRGRKKIAEFENLLKEKDKVIKRLVTESTNQKRCITKQEKRIQELERLLQVFREDIEETQNLDLEPEVSMFSILT